MHASLDTLLIFNSHLEHCNYNAKTLVLLNNDNSNGSDDNNARSSHPNAFASEFGTSIM